MTGVVLQGQPLGNSVPIAGSSGPGGIDPCRTRETGVSGLLLLVVRGGPEFGPGAEAVSKQGFAGSPFTIDLLDSIILSIK